MFCATAKAFRLRPPVAAACVALLLLTVGCGTVRHGREAAELSGRSLPTGVPPGSERLATEIDYDPAVLELVRAHGRPEYLHVVDRDDLFLYYTEANRVFQVRRNLIPPGVVREYAPIPGHLLKLLPAHEVARAQAKLRTRKAHTRTQRRTDAKPPPAARAPGASTTARTLNRFDLRELVERFRTPISAADPGVQDWRLQTHTDGTRSGFAKSRSLEFRIHSNSVSVTSPISAKSRTTPGAIRLGYYRVNRVVFGTRAHAISSEVEALVAKVAADPSGRTRVVRRLAGRTLQIARDPSRGTLSYRIGTD